MLQGSRSTYRPATTSAPTAAPTWTAPTSRRGSKDVRGAPGQCHTWTRHGERGGIWTLHVGNACIPSHILADNLPLQIRAIRVARRVPAGFRALLLVCKDCYEMWKNDKKSACRIPSAVVSAYAANSASAKTPIDFLVPNPCDIFIAFTNSTKNHAPKKTAEAL